MLSSNPLEVARVVRALTEGADAVGATIGAAHDDASVAGSPAETAARNSLTALYFEIVYNLAALNEGQRLSPPGLFTTRRVWLEGTVLGPLGLLLKPSDVALVAWPYIELDTYERLFKQPYSQLLAVRLQGLDQTLLGRLADQFRNAEETLRAAIFTPKQQEALKDAIEKQLKPIRRRGVGSRLLGVVHATPVWAIVATTLVLQLAMPDTWLWAWVKRIRKSVFHAAA